MSHPIQQAIRAIPLLSICFLLTAPAITAQGTVIEEGSVVTGPVEATNDPIRVGADVTIDGSVRTRNGGITIGARSEVGPVSTRNGAVELAALVQVAGGIETHNGRIEVGEGGMVRHGIETRNGRIDLGEGTVVGGTVHSRNGRIGLGDGARVEGSVATRNGAVDLGVNSRIHGDLDTRNGGLLARTGASIDGRVESRNGDVRLDDARVGRDVDVYRGDVHLRGASEIEGDLIVLMPEEPAWRSWIPFFGSSDPVVRIDADARVGGRLIVDERAELEIAPGADVPEPQWYASREAWPGR